MAPYSSEGAHAFLTSLTHRSTVRRHATRNWNGEYISPEGIRMAWETAEEVYQSIVRSPMNSVFYIVPSNAPRAQDTRRYIEEELQRIAAKNNDSSVDFFDFKDLDTLEKVKEDSSKRWVVINMPALPEIGLSTPTGAPKQAIGEWDRMLNNFVGRARNREDVKNRVHDLISSVSITRKRELPLLLSVIRQYVKDDYSDQELLECFSPAAFLEELPEDQTIAQLEAIVRETAAMKECFPGKNLRGTFIGHAPNLTWIAMAVLGMELNLANWQRIGGITDFLEPADFDFDERGNLVCAVFRGHHVSSSAPVRVEDVITRLRSQAQTRRQEWGS